MPRSRQYATPADRQAANRKRRHEEHANLYDALYRLENAVWEASYRSDPLATACRASDIPAMLNRLAEAFENRPSLEVPA